MQLHCSYTLGVSELYFEWDQTKNALNQKKHGISFEEGKSVFSDDFARLIADPDHSQDEEQFILLDTSIESNLLIVCHCIREEDAVRIISARKADKKERGNYERYRYAWQLRFYELGQKPLHQKA
ncbi:MAG: uncharacterized DUF497 family protein [Arenicella sp.]|jgi:uncharacterized DUF497 family protein